VRRLTSILTSLAVAAGAVSISSSVAMAAGGSATITRSATVAPAAVPNAKILRMVRLSKTNSFLVIGYNSQASAAQMHLWKIKEDLTIDTTFGAIDLGPDTALPTASNSLCVANSNTGCWYLNGLEVNETADRFIVTMGRQLNGTGSSSNQSTTVNTLKIGKLSTGAILATSNDLFNASSSYPVANWSTYGVTDFSRQMCTTLWGATYQSVPLQSGRIETYSTFIRPDGSIVPLITCEYSNMEGSNGSTHVKEYDTRGLIGLKVSGSSLVLDTSWGTNGLVKIFDDPTKCSNNWAPPSKSNTAIASLSSTDLFATIQKGVLEPRTTTYPYGGVTPASYDGCGYGFNPSASTDMTLLSLNVKGSIIATNTLVGAGNSYIFRWVIDPKGNWNTILNIMGGSTPTKKLVRLNTKGQLDTTLGTDGTKTLTGLPTSVTVNGASVTMQYSLSGVAVTSTGFYFTGFSTAGSSGCNSQNFTNKVYPYYLSADSGLVTTYGTNGLGEEHSLELTNTVNCQSSARLSYINSKGQHGYLTQAPAIGSQAAGLVNASWDAAEGVTSGGEGTGVAGVAGRVDKKVYSTKLPTTVQTDSALQVITAKQADDLDIRTSTPKICVALTTSVLLVNPGRCVVRIIDEDTKKVLRTMTTTVKATDVDAGTTLTTDEPIYFKQANVKLSKTALAQVKELAAAAASASRIVVIGHSAALGEVSQYSYAISRNRAEAVKAALIKAGVKKPIEIVALAYNQPEKTAKTEAAQAKNRRAEVFIFP
jgi:outer membrane protein OmpA-like peptidoglycan-associated protein